MAYRRNFPAFLAVMCFVLSSQGTFGQFDLGAEVLNKATDPPVPDLGNPFIENIVVQSAISSGLASTEMTVRLLNKADTDEATSFNFVMPLDALISNYTVSVIGKDKYYSSDDSSRIFDFQVSERGSDTRVFAVDVTVPAESAMELKLVYQQLLRRMNGQYRQNIYLKPGQVAENIDVDVVIDDRVELTSVESSWESSDDMSSFSVEPVVTRDGSSRASVDFDASQSDQLAESTSGMNGYLTIAYDADQGNAAGTLSVSNGYFLHRISPQGLSPINKNTLFLVDTSESMEGSKLENTQIALRNFIGGMKATDNFNVVSFSDVPKVWRNRPRRATSINKISSSNFIGDMETGSRDSDLYTAMESVVPMLEASPSEFQSIVLITDGSSVDPTSKVGDVISEMIDNRYVLNIIDLGDVDSDQSGYFLSNLATENGGAYRRVLPASDSNLEISSFLEDYSRPLMFNVETSYLDDVVDPDSLTKHTLMTYYDGQDLVVAGRLRNGTTADTITSRVTGSTAGGTFELETSAPVESTFVREVENYAERGWKFMNLTNQIDVTNMQAPREVFELAETFEFVLDDVRFPPSPIEGRGDVGGRGDTAAGDPHIVIQDPRSDLRICFDIHGPQGTVVSLVEDPVLNVAVNGEMVEKGNITNSKGKKPSPTFFGRIAILLGNDWITISRENVMVNRDLPLKWFRNTVEQVGSCKLSIVNRKVVKISCPNGVVMKILRHRVSHGDYDHFDFFLGKGQVFSPSVDGIIGQFQRQEMSLVKSSIRKTKYGKEKGVVVLGEKEIKVTKTSRRRIGVCWASYAKMGLPMLESSYEDYILPQLFSKRF